MDLGTLNASATSDLGNTIATSSHFADIIVRFGANYRPMSD